jgi:F-type H+-transporting ATPase subunit b
MGGVAINGIQAGFVQVAGTLLTAVAAFATEPQGHEAPHGADVATHETPSLFSVEPGLMIWTAVTFLVVVVVLRFVAWKPLLQALREREQSIAGAIEEAGRVKTDAEALHAKYQTMMDQIRDESRAILEEARRDGLKVQEGIRQRAQEEAEEFKTRARREIDLQTDHALKEIWQQAGLLSTELASRILGRSLTGEDHERLIRELLAEVRQEVDAGGAHGEAGKT